MFGGFLVLYVIDVVCMQVLGSDDFIWNAIDFWGAGLALFLLYRLGFPKARQFLAALILGLLAGGGYLFNDYGFTGDFSDFFKCGLITVLAATAVFSFIGEHRQAGYRMLAGSKPRTLVLTIALGLGLGVVMAGLNILALVIGGTPIAPDLNPASAFAFCLEGGIFEEICCRAVFLVFCLYLCKGLPKGRFAAFTCWFMMIMPHVLAHTPAYLASGNALMWLASTAYLLLLCGLPLAVLQRKRDITSAMLAHGTIDFVRYLVFGQ
jgi:hypothetical protein